jgi:polysaccharide pyruvyl transferase WcaK-like protein
MALVTLALVRDSGSLALLSQITDPMRLRLAADGIFLAGFGEAPPSKHGATVIELLTAGANGPVIGLNVRQWFHFANSILPYNLAHGAFRRRSEARMAVLLDRLNAVIGHLRERHDARVVLVSMYEPGVEAWEDDQPFLDRIKAPFERDDEIKVLNEDVSIHDLAHLLGRFDLMIGMRLHSALIGLRMGTPSLHIAYTLKGRGIYSDLSFGDWLIDIEDLMDSPAGLIMFVDRMLADDTARARVKSIIADVIARNRKALLAAVTEVGEK